MNNLATHDRIGLTASAKIAFLLIVSILLWSMGAPALLQRVHAANLTSVSDTVASSNLSTATKHTIKFTPVSTIALGGTIKISLDSTLQGGTGSYSEIVSAATSSDIFIGTSTLNGYTYSANCGGSGNQFTATSTYNTGTDENLTLSICGNSPNSLAGGTQVTVTVGSSTALWTNPAGQGSYRVDVFTPSDTGETRDYVLQNVTVTASVSTSFTFTVLGVASSTSIGVGGGGDQTSTTSTATAMNFGTLASGTPMINAQQLTVSTNARNGFSVTVQESQPPTSATGATIDLFANGATSTQPRVWIHPSAVLDVPSTYGHFGLTSNDADEGSGEFTATSTTPYVGNFDQPRVVFSHTGPADATTQNKGKAIVAYKMEISDLQEAGNDYTTTLTYVATPTF